MQKKILITVDVEDWFQVENLSCCIDRNNWRNYELRIEHSLTQLLHIFENNNIKATFFVLGWIAETCPDLIKKIASRGHEIASHGFHHKICSTLSDVDLLAEIVKSKSLLEEISGQQVAGFRAPNFSTTDKLFSYLKECGFHYDSSYNDFSAHGRYGSLGGHWHSYPEGLIHHNGLIELPVSNIHFSGHVVPWGGGAYFRLLPVWLFIQGVKSILKRQGSYIFYCHPWEFDPGQPYLKNVPWFLRFRHYTNIGSNLAKLESFLKYFQHVDFSTCQDHALTIFNTHRGNDSNSQTYAG